MNFRAIFDLLGDGLQFKNFCAGKNFQEILPNFFQKIRINFFLSFLVMIKMEEKMLERVGLLNDLKKNLASFRKQEEVPVEHLRCLKKIIIENIEEMQNVIQNYQIRLRDDHETFTKLFFTNFLANTQTQIFVPKFYKPNNSPRVFH